MDGFGKKQEEIGDEHKPSGKKQGGNVKRPRELPSLWNRTFEKDLTRQEELAKELHWRSVSSRFPRENNDRTANDQEFVEVMQENRGQMLGRFRGSSSADSVVLLKEMGEVGVGPVVEKTAWGSGGGGGKGGRKLRPKKRKENRFFFTNVSGCDDGQRQMNRPSSTARNKAGG